MWQNRRASEPELLDLGAGYYTEEEYDRCLSLLNRVNQLLGGFRATRQAFESLNKAPSSILDVGCGSGHQCQLLHRWFPEAMIVGTDLSQQAIGHAQSHLPEDCRQKVSFVAQKDKSLPYHDGSFDVVTASLVCHHMSDEELVPFLKECHRVCSHAVILNDLHRHILAYLSFSLLAPFAFPNRLIWHDGRLSVRRSFRRQDWVTLLEKAGFHKGQYILRWHWAFRWTLTLRKQ